MALQRDGAEQTAESNNRDSTDEALTPELAAQVLFDDPDADVRFTARDEGEAGRAVEEFARLFREAPGVFKVAMSGASAAAETLSEDRFQGLAEIIQNADDAHATFVEFRLVDRQLVAVHNGDTVTLSNILGLATPWLSTKTDDVVATGRFGIGLMTLRALTNVLDVHSGPYHVRLGDTIISWASAVDAPVGLLDPAATVFCLPLEDSALVRDDLLAWIDQWDESALLFLENVKRVAVLSDDGSEIRALRLTWSEDSPTICRVGGHPLEVRRRHAAAPDGRRWILHTAEAPRPKHVMRVRKKTGATVPLGLALALHPENRGAIYAGLPITKTSVPLRVNAQFDPLTSRSSLAPTAWNRAMLPLLADLWVEIVEDLFAERPVAAWSVVPLPEEDIAPANPIVDQLERLLLDRARSQLATGSAIVVDGSPVPLTELAVADAVLAGVLEPNEVAALSSLALALPVSAMDPGGRWRLVLADWRDSGAPLPTPVTVEAALALLGDSNRTPAATIRLTAVALSEGLSDRLAQLRCVVTADGAHIAPPGPKSLHGLIAIDSPLAETLGVGVRLANEYLRDDEHSQAVLKWLREVGATLVEGEGSEAVLRRLAAAGKAGNCLERPLNDDQLRALRDAFEALPGSERPSLGYQLGQAIQIAAYRYDSRGWQLETSARPADLYLSRAFDRDPDSFAVAAHKTQGLLWTADRYANQLRSSRGRTEGVGSRKFLSMLGVERAPRLIPHPGLEARYSGRPKGLPRDAKGSPELRIRQLQNLRATYTLRDTDSPDLRAVAFNIAKDRKATRRRQRANALLAALGRAWDRLEDEAEVDAVYDDYGWIPRGRVKAFWLWYVGHIAWLDDTNGVSQAPVNLRLKTDATIAVHGPDAPGYLRPEFLTPTANRREVVSAIGVAGEPNTRVLVKRLRTLRDAAPARDTVATDAAIIYQALADRITSQTPVPGDLGERELRWAFAEGGGLVHTELGWRPPADVRSGAPLFGRYCAFVPPVPRTDPLWRTLRIRQPSIEDCMRVIRRVAKSGVTPESEDHLVVLETLRMLAGLISEDPDLTRGIKRALANLPLHTTRGWTKVRPIYATDDPAILDGLGSAVPVWDPGGELSQFSALLAPLHVSRVDANAMIIDPNAAEIDEDGTDLLARAVSLLQDDVACNDAEAARALTVGWDSLREFEVRINPNLRVRVDLEVGVPSVEIEVSAKADVHSRVLFLRDHSLLRKVQVGRAIASLFATPSRRQLAHAWLAACVAADDGRSAQRLELAEQRAARHAREMAERTASLRTELASNHAKKARRRGASATGATVDSESGRAPIPVTRKSKSRILVDPFKLVVATANGQHIAGRGSGRAARRNDKMTGLAVPNRSVAPPRSITAPPGFTAIEKESVGMALARQVLESDTNEIVDLRSQRGVGADAIDSLDRYFELKVYIGDEPDSIHLEASQVRRALTTDDFFIVVVSNIEGADARPKVRIIVDPVQQLATAESSSVTFTGVRSAEHSLVYNLEPAPQDEGSD